MYIKTHASLYFLYLFASDVTHCEEHLRKVDIPMLHSKCICVEDTHILSLYWLLISMSLPDLLGTKYHVADVSIVIMVKGESYLW